MRMWSHGLRMSMGRASSALIGLALAASLAFATTASSKQFAYLSGFSSGEITAGKLRPDGSFSPVPGSPFAPGATALQGIATSPDGKHVFVADEDDDEFLAFNSAKNGALTDAPGSPAEVGSGPRGVAPTPNGKYVYVSSGAEISGFKVGKNGSISPTGQGAIANSGQPHGIAIDPKGKRLFSANGSGTVSSYTIDSNGKLTEVPSSPSGSVDTPYAIVVSPNGKIVYVANRASPISGVHAFRIGADGSLTELVGSPWSTGGDNAFSLAISPDGDYVYSANYADNSLAAFNVMSAGTLVALAGSPYPATTSPAAITLNAEGTKLFLNAGSGSVQTWSIEGGGVPGSPTLNLFGEAGDFQSIALTPAQPPKAKLSAKRKGRKVTFSAAKSTDDGPIVQYDWKFGDGGKTTTQKPRVKWRYGKKGTYKASVTLTDRDRCSTKYVSGGQTPYCNGSKWARAAKKVKIK